MGDKSKIEWTEATWNPVVGCSIVSPGCTNCYAMRMAERISRMTEGATGLAGSYGDLTKRVNGKPVWTGALRFVEHNVMQPVRWKRPRMIFVNSMSDLFHESVRDEWIDRVFAVMALTPQHTFQVLTKRADRMRAYIAGLPARRRELDCHSGLDWCDWPLPNVWLGVSAEDQKRADERIPHLVETPAAVRFVSAEPLLGPIDFEPIVRDAVLRGKVAGSGGRGTTPLDWIIVGGESGPGARPMHPDWARSIRDQCQAAGVPFFFKQHGEFVSVSMVEGEGPHFSFPDGATVRRIGKRAAGRLLDGQEHNEMPEKANG